MISSAGANKQPRSFWMSSSERQQQRLQIWSGFPPSVTTDCSSEALATLPTLLVESPAPKYADRWSRRDQESTRHIYQETMEFAGCVSASSISANYRTARSLLVFRKYRCGGTVLSSLSGSWRGMSSYFLCWRSRWPPPMGQLQTHLSCAFALKPISSAISSVFAFPDSWRREDWLHAFLLLQLIQGSEAKLI